jgi:hypothetical protein
MASGHVNRIKRPNTWLHRPMLQNVKKALANSEPSTHGTKRQLFSAAPYLELAVDRKWAAPAENVLDVIALPSQRASLCARLGKICLGP